MEISEMLRQFKTIALIGVLKDSSSDSNKIAGYLKSNGYKIIPVNPSEYEILDEKCYESLEKVPGEVDVVVLFKPDDVTEQALRKNVKTVWLQLGVKNEALVEKARQNGIEAVVDKCIMVEHKRFKELELIKTKTILVPILTERENAPEFLEKLKEYTSLMLLFVVDKNFLNHVPTAFTSSRIQIEQKVMEDIKQNIPKNIRVKDFVEWGEWDDKIESIARRENVDEIIMKKSSIADEIYPKLVEKGLKICIVQ